MYRDIVLVQLVTQLKKLSVLKKRPFDTFFYNIYCIYFSNYGAQLRANKLLMHQPCSCSVHKQLCHECTPIRPRGQVADYSVLVDVSVCTIALFLFHHRQISHWPK